jgi:hypothetical protein
MAKAVAHLRGHKIEHNKKTGGDLRTDQEAINIANKKRLYGAPGEIRTPDLTLRRT